MSARELARWLGRLGTISVGKGSLRFRVRVQDVKASYGSVRLLVAPVEGSGMAWVEELSFRPDDVVTGPSKRVEGTDESPDWRTDVHGNL